MENEKMISVVQEQLARTLNFFPRVDARGSVVLGIDIGMLAILAGNAPTWGSFDWYLLPVILPVILITLSLWHLFQSFFPRLDGGERSLIYFKEVVKRPESVFIDEYLNQSDSDRVSDFLRQTWRNSEILTKKYDHVKNAFIFLGWSILPWLLSLAFLVSRNAGDHLIR